MSANLPNSARLATGVGKAIHTVLYPHLRTRLGLHRRFAGLLSGAFRLAGVTEIDARVNGHQIHFLPCDNWAIRRFLRYGSSYDLSEIHQLRDFLTPESCFWDIGANYGVYYLSLCEAIGETSHAVLVEPMPEVFRLMQKAAIAGGRRGNVHCYNGAAGAEAGTALLYLSDIGTADSRTFRSTDDDVYNYGRPRRTLEVPMRAIDHLAVQFLPERPLDNVIKLDVQGFEMQVMRGATDLIEHSNRVVVFTEFWPHGLLENDTDPRELVDYFRGRDFGVLDQGGQERDYGWLEAFIDSECAARGRGYRNVFFTKNA